MEPWGYILGAVVVLASAAVGVVLAERRCRDDVPETPAPPLAAATEQNMTHWMEGWYRTIAIQEQALLLRRKEAEYQEQRGVARRNYLQGYEDALMGRGNRYMDVQVSVGDAKVMTPSELSAIVTHQEVRIHETWCPIWTTDDRGRQRACMCYFGARTNG